MTENDRQNLRASLTELRDLQIEARRYGHELDNLELTLAIQIAAAEISEFTYSLRCQQINRYRATINDGLLKMQTYRTRIVDILKNN